MKCKMVRLVLICLLGGVFGGSLSAQVQWHEEMRGAWVASVANIDWPSAPGLDDESLKKEIDDIVGRMYEMGFNALFVQVRPAYGVFYQSKFEPWSKYLIGAGKRKPGFDPLHYWIKACHRRGMECHAWINPYRVLSSPDAHELKEFLKEQQDPHRYIKYGKNLYMDPAYPENRAYILKIIREITENYAVDGLHFDDYFYPYKVAGEEYDDNRSYQKYKGSYTDRAAWRRNNVDLLIRAVHEYMSEHHPKMRFGISPFGVWRNASDDVRGSDTRAGVRSYDDLHADVLHWCRQGWLDYIAPQVYWHIGFHIADYATLVEWWSEKIENCDVYIGHALYKLDARSKYPSWRTADEIRKQVVFNRKYPRVKGSIFYNTNTILKNPMNIRDLWVNNLYAERPVAIPKPPRVTGGGIAQGEQPVWESIGYTDEGMRLYWAQPCVACRVMISRQRVSRKGKMRGKEKIIFNGKVNKAEWLDNGVKRKKYYLYRIVCIDAKGVRSVVVKSKLIQAK